MVNRSCPMKGHRALSGSALNMMHRSGSETVSDKVEIHSNQDFLMRIAKPTTSKAMTGMPEYLQDL